MLVDRSSGAWSVGAKRLMELLGHRPGSPRYFLTMAVFHLSMGTLWAALWWLAADREVLWPWFPGYICAPGFILAGALGLRKARVCRRTLDGEAVSRLAS